jgi:hypothetical protein
MFNVECSMLIVECSMVEGWVSSVPDLEQVDGM